jgi:E3 ubiquitin-protein ligase TRIP12
MATEETLQTFSVDSFLPPLIRLVGFEASAEIMLLSCRAIAYIIEAIPGSSAAVVHFGSIPPLCAKLMAIEYIDVAEQALLTLHKISVEHAGQLLRARGIPAVLSYLDFFPISVQRTGMSTVANMCKRVTADCLPLVVESVPQLSEMVLHTDGTLAEHVCTSFCRLVTSLSSSRDALEQIAGQGLIPNVWKVVSSWLLSGSGAEDKKKEQHANANFGVELVSQLLQ